MTDIRWNKKEVSRRSPDALQLEKWQKYIVYYAVISLVRDIGTFIKKQTPPPQNVLLGRPAYLSVFKSVA